MNFKSFYQEEDLFDLQIDQLTDSHTKNFGRVYLKNRFWKEVPLPDKRFSWL